MLTRNDLLEAEIHETLVRAVVGVPQEMPWGEKVTLLPGGDVDKMFPLTPKEARVMRMYRVHGVVAALVELLRR